MNTNAEALAWDIAERLVLLRIWRDSVDADMYLKDLLGAFMKATVRKAQQSTVKRHVRRSLGEVGSKGPHA